MSNVSSHLQRCVRSPQSGRVRAAWRVLIPILAGFLTLQIVSAAALTLDLPRSQMMVTGFAGTTVVMAVVLVLAARYLDRRTIREYGYRVSRGWWLDLAVGTAIGTITVAVTFVIAHHIDALQVTSSGVVPSPASLVWLFVFFVAFAGVAFYEEYIYRGSFITNAIEGLTARGVSGPVATGIALLASTVTFAGIHLPGAIAADASVALVVVKTGLLGGLFGVAYLRTGELAFPMGLHLGVNYALMNVFGIGAAGTLSIPSLLRVELTGTGLWSPSRGMPLFVAVLAGYALVVAWTRQRHLDRPAEQRNHLLHSNSDK